MTSRWYFMCWMNASAACSSMAASKGAWGDSKSYKVVENPSLTTIGGVNHYCLEIFEIPITPSGQRKIDRETFWASGITWCRFGTPPTVPLLSPLGHLIFCPFNFVTSDVKWNPSLTVSQERCCPLLRLSYNRSLRWHFEIEFGVKS